MFRWFVILFSILCLIGCARKTGRQGIISQELPLTVDDLTEIKNGKKNHEKVLWEYREYENPNLKKYCTLLAKEIGGVSDRPHLPYQVILLDSDEITLFGGPGGYLYITRGFFDFVQSEGELAGALAHEIVHVANFEYSNIPHLSKLQAAYNLALQGTELAKSSIGTYGTAVNMGLKGVGKAAPVIAKRFGYDEEIETDEKAVDVLVKAGFDPRGYQKFVDRLSKISVDDIDKFAIYMNTHPPFADRRVVLQNKISRLGLDSGKITFKKDMQISEAQVADGLSAAVDPIGEDPNSLVFHPQFAAADASQTLDQEKKQSMMSYRDKRSVWY